MLQSFHYVAQHFTPYLGEHTPIGRPPRQAKPPSRTMTNGPPTSQQANHRRTIQFAHPTLSNGKQSPMADNNGNVRDIPEDVKQHNEELEQRHDRP